MKGKFKVSVSVQHIWSTMRLAHVKFENRLRFINNYLNMKGQFKVSIDTGIGSVCTTNHFISVMSTLWPRIIGYNYLAA